MTSSSPLVVAGIDRVMGNFVRADYGGYWSAGNLLARIHRHASDGGTAFGEATTPHVNVDSGASPQRLRMDFTFQGGQGNDYNWASATMKVLNVAGWETELRSGGTGTTGTKTTGSQWTWPYEFLVST
jgi:hypothetical protein